jgi:hypothetical protein
MEVQAETQNDDHELYVELESGFSRMFDPAESSRAQEWINWLDEVFSSSSFRLFLFSYTKPSIGNGFA